MKEIIQEKLNQAVALLNEQNIDCWLTFARETSQVHDPALGLLLGFGLTWDSALIITRSGRKIAIVGRFDGDNVRALEAYDEVLTHDTGITQQLRKCLSSLNPRNIALNYSLSDSGSDGLTFGMYARLTQMLTGTPFAANFTSAENVARRLRERKTATELARIRRIVTITEQAYAELFASALIGKSEIEIHALSGEVAARLGVGFGWERANNPIVNAGPHSAVGHSIPGELTAQPGQLLHFDMGLRLDGYCSDLQRMAYIRREGETEAPAEVLRAWDACWCALETGKTALKAGVPGWQVDAAARAEIVRQGYPEYMHAVGHHVGQQAHDGGSLLGPRWEKYGNLPHMQVEAGNVFTLELGAHLSDYGFIGIEEMVLVTDTGADYISAPQRELILL